MIDPPSPGLPAILLTAAAKLGWRPTAGSLGALFDSDGTVHHLLMVRGEAPGSVVWTLAAELPRGLVPYLMSESTAKALREGNACDDAIELDALFLDGVHVAELVPA